MFDRREHMRATIVLLVLLGMSRTGTAQILGARGPMTASQALQTDQYVMTGKIEYRKNQYVMLDDNGEIVAYLVPKKSVDLKRFVGQIVEATVREPVLRTTSEPRLWVDRVAPVKSEKSTAAARRSIFDAEVPGQIKLTQYTNPVVVEGGPATVVPSNAVTVSDVAVPQDGGRPGRVWISFDFLGWVASGMTIPALVTTSPPGTTRDEAGVLGYGATQILYGNSDILDDTRGGSRLRGGVWFGTQRRYAIQGEYLVLEGVGDGYFAASDATGQPILARPFFNVNPRNPITNAFDPPAREDSQLVAYPNVVGGSVGVSAGSSFESGSLALRALLAGDSFCDSTGVGYSRVDMIAGYRYMKLDDDLFIVEQINSLQPQFPVSFEMIDIFDTRNEFHGVDLGMIWEAGSGKWSAEVMLKAAFGNVRQQVSVLGVTNVTQPNAPTASYAGGLLTQPTNIGNYSRDRISVVPELGLNLAYALYPRFRVTLGYTWIYWPSVVRPGDQIDLAVNPDQLAPPITPMAGAAHPAFRFDETSYWTHGLTLGLEGRW